MSRRATLALVACFVIPAIPALAADCDMWTDMLAPDFSPVAATIDTPYPIGLINACAADGSCPDHEPLRTGDRIIITSYLDEAYGCAVRIGPGPDYAIETGHVILNIVKLDDGRGDDWVGQWQSGIEKFIAIEQAEDQLDITGEASWGMSDPERVANGAINVGYIEASAKPKRGRLAFTMGEDDVTLPYDAEADYCSTRLWLAGEFLVAVDNNMCGGMNVTFTGFYTRQATTP